MGRSWLWVLLLAVAARRDILDFLHTVGISGDKSCTDAYDVYSASELHPHFIPKLGMGHVTVAGAKHHGLRNFEVWMQSLAPGVATPIHSHPAPCEEVNFVLAGSGLVRTRGAGGAVRTHAISVNSTAIAPPGTVWQLENTSPDADLQVLVVIGCRQPGITVHDSWDAAAAPGLLQRVMLWNKQCPPQPADPVIKTLA